MALKDSTVTKLRSRAKRLYQEYQAIYCLINAMTVDINRGFSLSENTIDEMNKNKLRELIIKIEDEIKYLRQYYSAKVSNQEFVQIAKKAKDKGFGKVLLVPKYIMNDLFGRYDRVLPEYNNFPEHLRIGIDAGTFRTIQGKVELYLLEAILFEDLCALFNLAKDNENRRAFEPANTKIITKTTSALFRSTITTAFYTIEAYLNGIAFDYYISNEKHLDDNSKMLLTEWDFINNRYKNISLRDKFLQYQRIILGIEHPTLQESNCHEFAYTLEKSKLLRDSIVHASPRHNFLSFEPEKEREFFNIDFKETELVVDNTIALIEKYEITIHKNTDRLWWLNKRSADGFFPDKVFQ